MWIAPTLISILFALLAIFAYSQKEKSTLVDALGLIWMLITAIIFIYSLIINPESYKQGQIDAINGKIKYEYFQPETDSTDIQQWRKINEK